MRKKKNSKGFTYKLKILLGTCQYGSDPLIALLTAKAPGAVSKIEYVLNKKNPKTFLESNNCPSGKLLLVNLGSAERGTAEWRLVNLAAEHACCFTPGSECQGGLPQGCWRCKQRVRSEWRWFAGRLPRLLCVSDCPASLSLVCGAGWAPEL